MKKTLAILLTLALSVSVLAGCSGTAVVEKEKESTETVVATEGTEVDSTASSTSEARPVKTGLSITTALSGSDATADEEGKAQADITIVAVTVDEDGVINSCAIDAIQAKNTFSAAGEITTEATEFLSKNELGADYGMVAYGGAIAEWNEQAASFAAYITGKTVDEVANIAVDETTKTTDTDLLSSVTIKIGGFKKLIEKAAQ